MSLIDFLFDNEWKQRRDIESLRERQRKQFSRVVLKASENEETLGDMAKRVENLEEQVGALSLCLATAIRLLQQHKLWDEREFQKLMDEIDQADGQRDGKTRL